MKFAQRDQFTTVILHTYNFELGIDYLRDNHARNSGVVDNLLYNDMFLVRVAQSLFESWRTTSLLKQVKVISLWNS
ncbi:hypothetical protein AQUCO_02500004v1 [Aquilegia coerulea]|uniref:Uncharacterized protein n=1 Tax=Aquilegia coerulea TaxID=218851 RepID=A0A2G5D8Y3_AQUCA|nr:hypothetical protein AQUCO_02500004v1 [Aquilegia coerulea]